MFISLVASTVVAAQWTGAEPAEADSGSCSNAEFRQGSQYLLNCRAYEQVSPIDKNGFDVKSIGDRAASGGPSDGANVVYQSDGAFADTDFGGGGNLAYRARRDAGGWSNTALYAQPKIVGLGAQRVSLFSPNMERSLLFSNQPLTDGISLPSNFYIRDNTSREIVRVAGSDINGAPVAAAADLGHVALEAWAELTDEPDDPGAGIRKVYLLSDEGLEIASRQPGTDAPFAADSSLGNSNFQSGGEPSLIGAVSDDGRHVFFTSPRDGAAGTIYRRTDGEVTAVASPSKRTPPADESRYKTFLRATPDGNRVFFNSGEPLTDDANSPSSSFTSGDLYRYDFTADQLIDLTAGTPGDADGRSAGIVDTSEDGDIVYFAARGEVVPGEGSPDLPKLYMWKDDGTATGIVRFIATLDGTSEFFLPSDDDNWESESEKSAQATSDGRFLAFQSRANLTDYDSGGTSQVYLYDAEASGGAGGLVCVSCNVDGASSGHAFVPTRSSTFGDRYPMFLSEDGKHVFFTSPDALLGRDSNGMLDAYEWRRTSVDGAPVAGEVGLLSSGRSGFDSYVHGAGADGVDVYFRTRERLVGQDGDTNTDLYTARIDGGLAGQQDEAAPDCEGDGCQAPSPAPPVPKVPGSSALNSPGNPPGAGQAEDCSSQRRLARKAAQRLRKLRAKRRKASDAQRQRRLGKAVKRAKTKAKTSRRKAKSCKGASR